MAAGLLALKLTVTTTGTGGSTALLWPALLATGLGMGMVLTPLVSVTLAAVGPHHAGAASGVQATGTNLGNAIGVAVIGVVFFAAVRGGYAHAFSASLTWLAAIPLGVPALVQFLPRR